MNKELFDKYLSPENQNHISYDQAKELLTNNCGLSSELVESDLSCFTTFTFDLLNIYLILRESCSCALPWALKTLAYIQKHSDKAPEIYDISIKIGDIAKAEEILKTSALLAFKNEEGIENYGFELFLSCENPQQAKPKFETVFSNIKTLLKNFSKKGFETFQLFDFQFEERENGVALKVNIKETAMIKSILNLLQNILKNKVALKFAFEMSYSSNNGLDLGSKYFQGVFDLEVAKSIKELLNEILYSEAGKLMSSKESFAIKYINRVSFFCLLQSIKLNLELKESPEFFDSLGEMIDENLQTILENSPPFIKKFFEAASVISGPCYLKWLGNFVNFEFSLDIPKGSKQYLQGLIAAAQKKK